MCLYFRSLPVLQLIIVGRHSRRCLINAVCPPMSQSNRGSDDVVHKLRQTLYAERIRMQHMVVALHTVC